MNYRLLFAAPLFAIALSACQKPSQKTSGFNDSKVGFIYETGDILLIEKGRLTKEERAQSVLDLFRSLEQNYVLWPYKQGLIGVAPSVIRDSCVAIEQAIDGTTYRSEFIDRVLMCLAQLKDSHLTFGASIQQSEVLTLISDLRKIDGRFYIGQNRPELIAYWQARFDQFSETLADDLKVGNEVISINGVPVQKELEQHKKYVSGSSVGTTDLWATWAILRRDYNYPKDNFLSLEVMVDGKLKALKVPWFYYPNRNLETEVLLGQRHLINLYDISLTTVDGKPVAYDLTSGAGTSQFKPIYSDSELDGRATFYKDAKARRSFVSFARLKSNPQVCYLKIDTFSVYGADAKVYSSDKTEVPLAEMLKAFKDRCADNSSSIQIDLRSNSGGSVDLALAMAGLFIGNDSDVSYIQAYNANKFMWPLIDAWRVGTHENTDINGDDLVYATFAKALKELAITTDWIQSSILRGPVFKAEIKVLTTPDCMSACEIFARILKTSPRTTIIGESVSGTGAGFQGGSSLDTTYIDRLNLFSLTIPNFLFTVLPSNTPATLPFDKSLIMENKPLVPDMPYSLTLKDTTDNYSDLKALLNK